MWDAFPKKVMFMAATMAEMMKHDAKEYGFDQPTVTLDFPALKKKRDDYIVRLNSIYAGGLKRAGVDEVIGDATFVDAHTLAITKEGGEVVNVTADKILVATGGRPNLPESVEGIEHVISSDGFFEMEDLPKKVVVVGAGYIAVELAGVLNGLGTDTHLVVRKHKALRNFDDDISDHLDSEMQRQGVTIHRNTNGVSKVEVIDGKKKVHLVAGGDPIEDVDVVLYAPGRLPNTETLNLDKAGVKLVEGKTIIQADDFQNTSADSVFALGDVCGKVELTPMAIAAGRRLADRLFGGITHAKTSYDLVPTVVFSHPTIGTCGMSEAQATEKYGKDNVKVYKSRFPNLYYGIFSMDPEAKPRTLMKLVCAGKNELVVGLHIIGMGADEMLQGFGVAMKMGCTKSDLDSCIAIHPTGSEELVTMGTWGTAPEETGAKISPLMGAVPPEPTL